MMSDEKHLVGSGIGRPTGGLTDEMIERHNAGVRAFEERMAPVIEALTDDQCREVAIAMQTEDIGANTIGRRMRPVMGNVWDEAHDIGAGIRICAAAFRRYDIYDPDFNKGGTRTLEQAFGQNPPAAV